MSLPVLISVPHAGLRVPPEVERLSALTPEQIAQDGDVGAADIYALEREVSAIQVSDIARAFVDLNRGPDDRSTDGIVKTHTCWNVPVYSQFPPEATIELMLERYYWPYHEGLRQLAGGSIRLGVDCHTMAAQGPPIGPDPGAERPWACLSNAGGTCPQEWIVALQSCFQILFEGPVRVNDPFQGGHIIRAHSVEMPWVQLELSRAPFLPVKEKHRRVLQALRTFCQEQSW